MFEEHLQNTLIFFKTNPIVAVVVCVFFALCLYSRPKETFKLIAFCGFMVVAFYIITLLAGAIGSGSSSKDQMIYKTQRAIDE